MKIITVLFLGLFIAGLNFTSFSQEFPAQCKSIEISNSQSAENAEDCVLKLSDYILSQHVLNSGPDYFTAAETVNNWITRTMNYTIEVNKNVQDLCVRKNENLIHVYRAALAHEALNGATNFHKQAVVTLVEYIRDDKNNVRVNRNIKKLLQAHDSGEFEEYYK
ncbi:MAG: hypothetical protein R6U95_02190 [Bacteroidales bacterium]